MVAPYRQPTYLEEGRTLWIGGLRHSVDEKFLYGCFAHTGEVQSVRLIRNKLSGLPEGYGFIEFISHEAAGKVLQTYNGAQMPGTEYTFRLNWASSFSCGERRPHEGPNHSYAPYQIPKTSSGSRLQDGAAQGKEAAVPSVGKINNLKIVCDADERRPHAGPDHSNGGYCSIRPMRTTAIPNISSASQIQNGAAKATYPASTYTNPQAQTVLPDSDLTNTTVFIGNLDPNVTEEVLRQICVQFGKLMHVMIPVGEGCRFVQYASMASAKEAVQRLHGTVIGQQVVRLSWGRSPATKQVEGTTNMATAAGSHVPGMEQNKVYDPMNLPNIDKRAKVVTDQSTGRSKGYGFVKLAVENEKTCAVTETNGAYCSTGPTRISAAIPKKSSGSQLHDGAAKDTCSASDSVLLDESPILVGSIPCSVANLASLPLMIGSVSEHPTLLVERKKKMKKKRKKKRKKRTGSASPRKKSLSPSSTIGSSAPPWGDFLPVWSLPWSGLPCGCPWPVSPTDALNIQPAQYGLHHLPLLPDEPNKLLASFKPWLQRFYGYGGTIPCPHDLISLEAFKQKCPLTEPYVLHNGEEIGVASDSGRFVLGGIVEDVINTFKSGYSWGGDFSKDDIAVQLGVRCYISKMPLLRGTYKNLCKDLDKIAECVIPHFRGVFKIAFIEHLYHTMKNPPPASSTAQERQRYLKFLKSHPARADPLSVSSLLVGIAQTYKSMGLSDKKAFEAAVKKIDSLKFDNWREKVKSVELWNTVYTAKQKRSTKKKKIKERYGCTAISLSTYLRHFIIHSPEYTLVDGVQLMKTIDEVDYLVADFFDEFIAELFKFLVYDFDMEKDVLKSVWKMYDAGEDRKEVIKRIWKCETKLDFMLETQEVTLMQSHAEASTSGQAMAD